MRKEFRLSLAGRGVQRRAFDVKAEEDEDEEMLPEEEEPSLEDEGGEEKPPEEEEERELPDEDEEKPPEGDEPQDGGSPAGGEEPPEDEEEEEERRFMVEGYAATFNSPYLLMRGAGEALYEQVDSRAFDNAEMRDVILQYDHGGRVFARQSNGTLQIAPDARGLHVRADLSGTEEGRKLWREIRGGYTTKMSLSFTVDDDDTVEAPGGGGERRFLRTIRKVGRVYDVSAVSLPANEGTEIAARSRAGAEREAAEALSRALEERERLALEIAFELCK